MSWASNVIIALGAIALLSAGTYLGLQNESASAGTVLGFGFLLVVLLLLAKFKRIKGFGFEAEMWDEKQIQAAVLVDKLTALATLTSEQVALISAKLGLWDSALTNPQMIALLKQADTVLQATDVPKSKRDEILAPIRDRIALNYLNVAHHIADAGFKVEIKQLNTKLNTAVEPERGTLAATIRQLEAERNKLNGRTTYEECKAHHTLEPIRSLARTLLTSHDGLLRELSELEADLVAFRQNQELRRDIDLSPLLGQNAW